MDDESSGQRNTSEVATLQFRLRAWPDTAVAAGFIPNDAKPSA